MSQKSIQDILTLVEMPSRYLGSEINRIKKEPDDVNLWVALAFPDLYEIGTSHFGIQILYHLLNNHPKIAAERVFAPATDLEEKLRVNKMDLFSLESWRAIKEFNILGFSLLYELTYTNVLNMLELSRIPLLSSERDLSYPLVIAGGPCTCNPEPMADIFDAMVIGDGEDVLLEICESWFDWQNSASDTKNELLEKWAGIEGVYIPSFFKPKHNDFYVNKTHISDAGNRASVKRTVIEDLNQAYFPKKPLIPFGKPVHDRLRLELSRGCSRGCRFCQAGMIYRPVRERDPHNLITLADYALKATGYEDISLLSLSTGDYGCINNLINSLIKICKNNHVAVSLPSLRAGTLNSNLMEQIKKVRKTGFTIAPEAGSQRLRDVINKNITEQNIIQTIQNAFELGWRVFKLYFMIGLPTETKDDLNAIVDLIKKICRLRGPKGERKKINVSITTFIPKPHTPFQWESQISREHAWEIIYFLKDALRMTGVKLKWQNPDVSFVEGIMARGDRRLLKTIIAAHHSGCKFDGWNDYFSFKKWDAALNKTNITHNYFENKRLDPASPLPWDHIDSGINKAFLLSELKKALNDEVTYDCRWNGCIKCGVCDFKKRAPVLYKNPNKKVEDVRSKLIVTPYIYKKFYVTYQKKGDARFFGHLEMVKIFHRALKRGSITVAFSGGFHPMPKISFDNPIPIGMESVCEHFIISILNEISPDDFKEKLNHQLPNGLKILKVKDQKHIKKARNVKIAEYQITINDGFFDQNSLHYFNKSMTWVIERRNRKGLIKKIDLKKVVRHIRIDQPNRLSLSIIEEPGKIVRPFEILEHVLEFENTKVRSVRVLRLSAYNK
jgi:radical SAM family uncharacterized protein/radical SAM-linked protein